MPNKPKHNRGAQYGVRRYPNRDVWYVYDYWNRVVVSTPWYLKSSAMERAEQFNWFAGR